MSYSFELYITGVSPAKAMSLFDEDVAEGKARYAIPKRDGDYVFYTGFASQSEIKLILDQTNMRLDIDACCTISRGGVDVAQIITTAIDKALHDFDNDFLALVQFSSIIVMRKSGEIIVNTNAQKRFGLDPRILDMPHQIRELPHL